MRNLKYAISNIAWVPMHDEEMYTYLQKHHFSGIEIAPTRIFSENPYDRLDEASAFQNFMKKYELTVCSMQSIWYGRTENIFGTSEEYEALVAYTKKAIDFAEAIGCDNLVFGCPKNRNMENPSDENYKKAIQFFDTIGKYALSKHVVIALEPNPTIYNTNFLNTTKEALDFIREIGLESIQLNCDLGTMIYNEEDISLIIDYMEVVNHIHISEPHLASIQMRKMHKKLFDALEKVGYSKFVSIEMKNHELSTVKDVIHYVEHI